ncbi:MAG: hypothetical protein HY391_05425 [Deltaproteobacteria bacterium]|nr:hypothetical protein [Deltaproteobacteria bacterium]
MFMTAREFWTVIHGLLLGTVYLLAFSGGFAELWSLWKNGEAAGNLQKRVRRIAWGAWVMAITGWLTLFTGTYIVYPWYREKTADSPRSFLLADPLRSAWHTFGMEWKEHIAWMSPILATAVAVILISYGESVAKRRDIVAWIIFLFVFAFLTAAVAGLFGAFINKVAPIH